MNYYSEIKEAIINNQIIKKAKDYSKNRSDLNTYYNVGKLLAEAGKHYGEGIIKEYSLKLTKEFGKGYSTRSLKYMRKFYFFQKGQTLSAQLTWSHYSELLTINNVQKINYYMSIVENRNLSVRELRKKIKNNEYERLDDKTKLKLSNKAIVGLTDIIKNPILIKSTNNKEEITEKMLKRFILEDIDNFLTELGEGFSYIKNEYKIKIGNQYNYVDLLLYNIKYNSYVVIELK